MFGTGGLFMKENAYVPKGPIEGGRVTTKVIIEKSRGEGSLMEQDTIENVS